MNPESNLTDQALTNLINQFARPLDFLRELIQNSLDAGTPRIEVRVAKDAGNVVTICVADFGEGMDEDIIDNQLIRLFSSTKEGDLTKIGKFGIGFTSVFAIRPAAVLVRTGRHGENWEVLFKPDRTIEKYRIDEPVTGTEVKLFKRMNPDSIPKFVRDLRYVLTYWCEHSHTPITFHDWTEDDIQMPRAEPVDVDSADPFAAFAAPDVTEHGERVSRPFTLDKALVSRSANTARGTVVVGYTERPSYGFYNGGLTLVSSQNIHVLGSYAKRLQHVSFKVRSDHLEHTLTRDNVLQDTNWEEVMKEVVVVANQCLKDLIDGAEAALLRGDDMAPWHRALAVEAEVAGEREAEVKQLMAERTLFASAHGPTSLKEVEAQSNRMGCILTRPRDPDLAAAITGEGITIIDAPPDVQRIFRAFSRHRECIFINAEQRFVVPGIVQIEALSPREQAFFERVEQYFKAATGRGVRVGVAELGGDLDNPELAICGRQGGVVFERKVHGWQWLWVQRFLIRRHLLINRDHPHVRSLLAASFSELTAPAMALTQLVLNYEDVSTESSFKALYRHVVWTSA